MNLIDEQSEPLQEPTPAPASELTATPPEDPASEAQSDGLVVESAPEGLTRRKLEEQLEALKRKEVELRRALVIADHPELADAIRLLQGRTYALERCEENLAAGLTKAEQRRRETLQKKRVGLEEKRAELEAQIAELDGELESLGVERQRGYESDRQRALEELLMALGTHHGELQSAGIEPTALVPELVRWMPEIEALAETLAARKISN